ncbi:MAG: Gfo/Idh/MocA family oxidoreductase [Candidatus Bathyarchaeota archaeon]|nr:Gfo/Idh/MocA family oxidoreductase [Candidatus Bathyarchaeota archaeon]
MNKLGVGFIGSGFIARFAAQGWTTVRDADVAAIYNPHREGAEKLATYCEGLGLGKPKTYTDLHAMLADKAVNAVWVMNPNFARLETVKAITEEARQGKGNLVGVACEKPLGRTADEAEEMVKLVEKTNLLHGYLENQVYSPSVVRGRDAIWRYGARKAGRPYLARAAEEHGGPHMPWFWDPLRSGGGVLLDMACHSIEAARFLLTDPEKPGSLKPVSVQADIRSLKWTHEPAMSQLKAQYGVDYSKAPAEDYASVNITYDDEGESVLSEAKVSWCYTGPGLRLSVEVLGPEYSVAMNSLQQELSVFLSRNIKSGQSEDFVEKQAAEQGLMPIVPDEAAAYGYSAEHRHMADAFRRGIAPSETWHDGLLVTRLMMLAYKSAEEGKTLKFSTEAVHGFVPKVAKGTWHP